MMNCRLTSQILSKGIRICIILNMIKMTTPTLGMLMVGQGDNVAMEVCFATLEVLENFLTFVSVTVVEIFAKTRFSCFASDAGWSRVSNRKGSKFQKENGKWLNNKRDKR